MSEKRTGLETVRGVRRPVEGPKLQRRSREWEKRHPPLTYRVPSEIRNPLREDIARLARQYGVPVGEKAGWLLRQAIDQVDSGGLAPDPQASPGRLSLVPRET